MSESWCTAPGSLDTSFKMLWLIKRRLPAASDEFRLDPFSAAFSRLTSAVLLTCSRRQPFHMGFSGLDGAHDPVFSRRHWFIVDPISLDTELQ
jgi:hypothetical protein